MAKINYTKWKSGLKFEKIGSVYRIEGKGWYKTTSSHGKSKGAVKCPCCEAMTEIYIWSFRGSGKRCSNCNVMLGANWAYAGEIPADILSKF